jgi:hypothetical protein
MRCYLATGLIAAALLSLPQAFGETDRDSASGGGSPQAADTPTSSAPPATTVGASRDQTQSMHQRQPNPSPGATGMQQNFNSQSLGNSRDHEPVRRPP